MRPTAGRVFLTDFGLARDTTTGSRFTRTGATLGTPAYMPPEQARGELGSLTPAADVWSLACVLYEMVAGRRAFDGTTPAEVVGAVLTRDPTRLRVLRPDAPAGVERLVRACLAKAALARPANAAALRDDCERVLAGRRPLAQPPGRRRWLATAAVLLIAGALGAAGFLCGGAGAPARIPVSPAMAQAEALARQAHGLRQSEPREAARFLGEALALHERERPANEAERAAWRLERGLLLWAVGEGRQAQAEWGRVPSGAPEAMRAQLYRGLESFFRLEHGQLRTDEALPHLHAADALGGRERFLARAAISVCRLRWRDAREALSMQDGWEVALLRGCVEGTDPEGDRSAAVREYTAGIASGIPFAWALYERGKARCALGDLEGAITDFGAAIRTRPDYARALLARANAKREQGDLPGVVEDCREALRQEPGYVDAHGTLAQVLLDVGDLQGAATSCREILRLAPQHPWAGELRRVLAGLDDKLKDQGAAKR